MKTIKDLKWIRDSWQFDPKWIGVKERGRIALRKIYKLKPWHDTPLNAKPYAMYTLKWINRYLSAKGKAVIVEIGCGLGDIIGNIRSDNRIYRYGYDKALETIKCARLLHPGTSFRVGSFDEVCIGCIDVLIMVGFLHIIEDEELSLYMKNLIERNDVKLICFDTQLYENGDYPFVHSGETMLLGRYSLLERSRGFNCAGKNRRYIEFWSKNE